MLAERDAAVGSVFPLFLCRGGIDPRLHYWYAAQPSDYRRLCDDAGWEEPTVGGLPFNVPCSTCRGLYHDDQDGGGIFCWVYSSDTGYTRPKLGILDQDRAYPPATDRDMEAHMVRVSMATFARFYGASPSQQMRIVNDHRSQQVNRDRYIQRDFYGTLRQTLRRTHWATGDIDAFRDAIPELVERQQVPARRDAYQDVSQAYIDLWLNRGAEFFTAPTDDITVGALTIRVNPEVGMRTVDGAQALKVWFNVDPMPRRSLQACHFLMERASATWDEDDIHAAIWDVRRLAIPLPPRLPAQMADYVAQEADRFVRMVEDMERRDQLAEDVD